MKICEYIIDCKEICHQDSLSSVPLVSVLMTTFNHEKFISYAIEGVVKQKTDFPIELLIGEDCSNDNTLQIVLDYQKKFPNLIRVFFPEKNMGSKKNFIRLLAHSRGRYVALCEGDDYWVDPNKLQIQVDFLEKNKNYIVTYHNAFIVDSNSELINPAKLPNIFERDYSQQNLKQGPFILTLSMCYRNVIKEFPEEFFNVLNGDTFLISMLGNYGDGHYMSEISPAAYRQHAGGVWSSINDNKKNIQRVSTFFWLSHYYNRIGDEDTARHFAGQSVEKLVTSITLKNYFFEKYLIRNKFPSLHKGWLFIKNAFKF